jgi:hypothetical protein
LYGGGGDDERDRGVEPPESEQGVAEESGEDADGAKPGVWLRRIREGGTTR